MPMVDMNIISSYIERNHRDVTAQYPGWARPRSKMAYVPRDAMQREREIMVLPGGGTKGKKMFL